MAPAFSQAPKAEVRTCTDSRSLAEAAARLVGDAIADVTAAKDRAVIALSGGSTPIETYRRLAAHPAIDWARVHVCQVDERCVPPDDPDSNWRMIREAILQPAGVPLANQHRMAGEIDPENAAADYEAELRALFAGRPAAFDAVVLGIGEDGHVASLFPDAPALDERDRWVVHTEAPHSSPVRNRVTLTLPLLDTARLGLYIVAGAGKREVAARAIARDGALPAARVQPAGRLVWLLDAAAAGEDGSR